jgi:plasmid stabilization system protein ParE
LKRVRYSLEARRYIREEAAYLRLRSPAAADRLLGHIKLLTKNLSTFPTLGHMSDQTIMPSAHRFVIGEYVADYEILEDEVLVFAIRHGRQRPPNQPLESDDDYEAT